MSSAPPFRHAKRYVPLASDSSVMEGLAVHQKKYASTSNDTNLESNSLPSRSFLRRLTPQVAAVTTAAVTLFTTEKAEAIFYAAENRQAHLDIGQQFSGTLFSFNYQANVPGHGLVNSTLGSATFYRADSNGNGFGFTAKHNIANVLNVDSNATFSIYTGNNFKTDRGFEFAITGYEFFSDSDVAIFKFTLGDNEPGLVNNYIGPASSGAHGMFGGFGVPKTYTNPQPVDDGFAWGGYVRITPETFNDLPSSHYISSRPNGVDLGINLTGRDSGAPLAAPFTDLSAPKELWGIGKSVGSSNSNYARLDVAQEWADNWMAYQISSAQGIVVSSSGEVTLNPQTNLFSQQVVVRNNTATASGIKLLTSSLPSGVSLHNASGITAEGAPYLQIDAPLPPGEERSITLEYRAPGGQQPFAPALAVRASAGTPLAAGALPELSIEAVPGGAALVLKTEAGRRYEIQCSPDLQSWAPAGPPFTAGSLLQWIDTAEQPHTPHAPGADGQNRYYRVKRLD